MRTCILCTYDISNFSLIFSIFLGGAVCLQVFFLKLLQISRNFSYIEKNPQISGPVQFKLILFKGQLYYESQPKVMKLCLDLTFSTELKL